MACWKGLPCFTFMPVVVTDLRGFRIKPFEDHVIVQSGMDTQGNGNSQSLGRDFSSTCLEMMTGRLICKVKVKRKGMPMYILHHLNTEHKYKCVFTCTHVHLYNRMHVG